MSPSVPTVTATEVPADGVLIDVREDDEWAAGHAGQAVHLPLGDLPVRLGEVPRDARVHVVCRSGARSARAVAFLLEQGVDAVNVDGGMRAWAAAGLPMTADGTPTVL